MSAHRQSARILADLSTLPFRRHLFAESPPSVSAALHAQRQAYYNGQGQYGGQNYGHHFGRHNVPPPYTAGYRDQVIFASDGKVLQLKLADERR